MPGPLPRVYHDAYSGWPTLLFAFTPVCVLLLLLSFTLLPFRISTVARLRAFAPFCSRVGCHRLRLRYVCRYAFSFTRCFRLTFLPRLPGDYLPYYAHSDLDARSRSYVPALYAWFTDPATFIYRFYLHLCLPIFRCFDVVR